MSMRMSRAALCGLAIAAAAGAAIAQSATQDVNLNASVAQFCTFNAVTLPGGSLVNVSVVNSNTSQSVIAVTNPINTSTGTLNAASFQMTLASVCNTNSRVQLVTHNGGMTPGSVPPVNPANAATFATKINYTATAIWGGTSIAGIATDGSTAPGTTSSGGIATGPRAGNLVVNFNIDSSPSTVVAAGTYTDTLTVRLEPQ